MQSLDRNTRQFLAQLPCNNVLLYGERGTGKSSALRGLLSRYGSQGLRVIEVERHQLAHLPRIMEWVRGEKDHHFLIFCDDLSFSPSESGHRELKAALEGSLQPAEANVMIVATSNRRHLVPDLDNEILILKGKPNLIFHLAVPLVSQVLNLHSRYVPSTPVRLHQFRKWFGTF